MKTSVEISGYTISIEETDGVISVNAVKEDEVVEEFTIQIEEGEEAQGFEGEEVKPFGELEDEEEDFEGGEESGEEEFESEDEDEDEDEDERAPEGALESFQSFINKKK